MITDVQDGDVLRLDRHEKASRRSDVPVPATFPLSHEVLTRTHGVPALKPDENDNTTAGTISWMLECPGMLINHSCDPNVRDDSHDAARGEAYATRDIKKGEELCYDYTLQYYNHGPFFEKCLCGTACCRGKMMGFKALSDTEKEKILPLASEAVRAMHEAELGTGLPVKHEQVTFPPRANAERDDDDAVLRLVVPGPSHAEAPVRLEQDESTGKYGLFATKDFDEGDLVYEFWTQLWPKESQPFVDMVLSANLLPGDPKEGTTIRVNALESAKRNREGELLFSGFDLFTAHSCEPNLVYNDKSEDEDDDWRGAYAARPIQEGEELMVDFNTLLWDRTYEVLGDGVCTCGAKNCRGIVKGFKFLSTESKEELKNMTWKRTSSTKVKGFTPGEALTPHVRVCWRENGSSVPGGLVTSSSDDESSSDEED